MNREEILAMEPGRELDAFVAEKIMGWTKFGVREDGSHCGWNAPYGYSSSLIGYSQIISAAWEVFVKFGHYARIETNHSGGYIALINGITAYAQHAPEAICKAALLAILPDKEEETR